MQRTAGTPLQLWFSLSTAFIAGTIWETELWRNAAPSGKGDLISKKKKKKKLNKYEWATGGEGPASC